MTPRKITSILNELDDSEVEELDEEDEDNLVTRQVTRAPLFDGNWSDDTDNDPDYVPDSSPTVTPPILVNF